jgi:protein-disulfide isomerase
MSFFKAVIRTAISFALLSSFIATQATAQSDASDKKGKKDDEIRKELRELRQGQEELRRELNELKQLLLAMQPAQKPAPPEKISIAARPARGSETARIVMVEFSDYQCPFCALFFRQTLPQLDQDYIKTGKIKYVFNNVPLDNLHPAAFKAAEAAECAGDQSRFWEMHDKIFANPRALSATDLSGYAKAVGVDLPQFSQCLESGKNAPSIKEGLALAERLGVDGTPTFVIALSDAKNPRDPNIKVLGIISGAQPFSVFKSALDKALAMQ